MPTPDLPATNLWPLDGPWPLDEGSGPALTLSEPQASRLLRAALKDAGVVVAPPPGGQRGRRFRFLAAGLILAGASAAATPWARRALAPAPRPPSRQTPPTAGGTLERPASGPATGGHGESPAAIPVAKPVAMPAGRIRVRPPVPAQVALSAPQKVTPDALAAANRLRGERQWAAAETLYRRIQKDRPGSDEGYIATVAAASLRAEHLGDPTMGLSLFQAALTGRPAGSLSEEARLGIAACHRLLGDRAAERRALEAFLQASPHSLNRARAEARLAELVR